MVILQTYFVKILTVLGRGPLLITHARSQMGASQMCALLGICSTNDAILRARGGGAKKVPKIACVLYQCSLVVLCVTVV